MALTGIPLSSGFNLGSNKPIDAKYGPFSSTEEALSSISSNRRYMGLTVGVVDVSGQTIEYWFQDGIADANLVRKTALTNPTEIDDSEVLVKSGTISFGPLANTPVQSFACAKNLTTFGEWKKVRDWALNNGYSFNMAGSVSGLSDNHPIVGINWYDAVLYCNAKSEMEGLSPSYRTGVPLSPVRVVNATNFGATFVKDNTQNGYRLPTNQEWEWAARGGIIDKNLSVLSTEVWHSGNSTDPQEVGKSTPNELGIYDMIGNIWEWTNNPDPNSAPSLSTFPVTRGGSYIESFNGISNFISGVQDPGSGVSNLGFRVVRTSSETTLGTYIDVYTAPDSFKGASVSIRGKSGLVPTPLAGDQQKVLRGNGTWSNETTANSVIQTYNRNTPYGGGGSSVQLYRDNDTTSGGVNLKDVVYDLDNGGFPIRLSESIIPSSQKGTANGIATLDANAKLTASQLPSIAISDFLGNVDNENEMLAKDGQKGDWVIRDDQSKVYVITGDTPSVASSWTALQYPIPSLVTAEQNGLMLSTDKLKLDNILYGAEDIVPAFVGLGQYEVKKDVPYATHLGNGVYDWPWRLPGGQIVENGKSKYRIYQLYSFTSDPTVLLPIDSYVSEGDIVEIITRDSGQENRTWKILSPQNTTTSLSGYPASYLSDPATIDTWTYNNESGSAQPRERRIYRLERGEWRRISPPITDNGSLGKTDLKFFSNMPNNLLSTPVGGAPSLSASAWEAKTVNEILDEILFPTVLPTYTVPTAELLFNPALPSVFEVGQIYSGVITATFIKNDAGAFSGDINIARSGASGGNGIIEAGTEGSATDVPGQFNYPNPNNPNRSYIRTFTDTFSLAMGITSWTGTASGGYSAGLAKKNNKGLNDTRPPAVRSINAPQAAHNFETTFAKTVSVNTILPWFWGKSSTQPTKASIATAIASGSANRILASANGTLSITFAAANEFIWFALPNFSAPSTITPAKTKWYIDEINKGSIESTGLFLPAGTTQAVDAPLVSPETTRRWTGIQYQIYISAYATTVGQIQILE
jgi:formylglycine-generating enzyme required for sulfatase activity